MNLKEKIANLKLDIFNYNINGLSYNIIELVENMEKEKMISTDNRKEFNNILSNIMFALKECDYLMVSDLLEYRLYALFEENNLVN